MKFYSIDIDRDATCGMIGGFKHDHFVWREVVRKGHPNHWSDQVQVDVTFVTEDGIPERLVDYVDLPGVGFPAISDKARQVVLEIAPESVELFPVELVHDNTDQYLGTYWIMKVVRTIRALDFENTQWRIIPKEPDPFISSTRARRVALLQSMVKYEDLFELERGVSRYQFFVSAKLRNALVASNAADGFKFIEADVF